MHPMKILNSRKVKKAKEDLNSVITPIGRDFILVKVGQPKDFQS
jgi:hypothetical protein